MTAAFAAAASTWLALLVAAPYLASHMPPGSVPFDAASFVYLFGHSVCHQRAERSFHAWGVQLPVCARCLGLYASAAAGAVFGAWVMWAGRTDGGALTRWRWRLVMAAIPTAASVGLEAVGIWAQSRAIRAVAAVPLGFTVAWFVAAHVGDLIRSMSGPEGPNLRPT